jgi:hypothetical protein
MNSCFRGFLALTVLALMSVTAHASDLQKPEGRVILTVTGNITHTNADGKAEFDRKMLEALAGRETKSTSPWYDGVASFKGPLGQSILEAVGASGTTMKVAALNDYFAEVPVEDFLNYPVILAMEVNGKRLRVRDKGPLFVIYPFDEFPDLVDERIYNRSVWQVKSIHVE